MEYIFEANSVKDKKTVIIVANLLAHDHNKWRW